MLFLLLLARRFLFKKRGSTIIASTAVAATIFLSIFTGVIFTGVKLGLIEEISDFQVGHVLISNDKGLIRTEDSRRITLLLNTHPEFVERAPRITTGMDINFTTVGGKLSHNSISTLGVDPILENRTSGLMKAITEGSFIEHETEIVLGSEIMNLANAEIGSIVTVKLSGGNVDVSRRLLVVGISDIGGFPAFSDRAIVHINVIREMMDLDDGDSSFIIVKLNDVSKSPEVADWLQNQMEKIGWDDDSRIRAEPLEVNVKQLIITFDQLIAFINLIGYIGMAAAALGIIVILIMMVSGKTREIGLLRAIGLKKRNVIMLFILNGAIIGFLGAITGGSVGAIVLLYLQHNPIAFFGGIVPIVIFDPMQLLIPMILGFSISVFSSIYPAWKASKSVPAEAMRYF